MQTWNLINFQFSQRQTPENESPGTIINHKNVLLFVFFIKKNVSWWKLIIATSFSSVAAWWYEDATCLKFPREMFVWIMWRMQCMSWRSWDHAIHRAMCEIKRQSNLLSTSLWTMLTQFICNYQQQIKFSTLDIQPKSNTRRRTHIRLWEN